MSDTDTIRPIDLLDLSTRVRNALVRAGLTTPQDLMHLTDEELLARDRIGPASVKEVRERLAFWEQQQQQRQDAPRDAEPILGDPFPRLPGHRVLHAAWLPVASGGLFVWGEGPALSTPPSGYHPFHIPPADLRDLVPDGMLANAEKASALARLPIVQDRPQPSPQLILDEHAAGPDDVNVPESLGLWRIDGLMLPPGPALTFLMDLARPEDTAPHLALGLDLGIWSLAAKLVLELLARQQFAPMLVREGEAFRAVWVPVFDQPEDLGRVDRLARAMPPVGRAVAPDGALDEGERPGNSAVRGPSTSRALLKAFVGTLMDAAVRQWMPALPAGSTRTDTLPLRRWLKALCAPPDQAEIHGTAEDLERLYGEVTAWLERLMAGAEAPFRVCLRLEAPPSPEVDSELPALPLKVPRAGWTLRFFLQARDDPSLLVPASLVWRQRDSTLRYLDRRFEHPQEALLSGLGQAASLFPPLEDSLRAAHPESCHLTTEQAYTFLRQAAPVLEHSGFGVLVPPWWRKDRRKKLGVRASISATDGKAGLDLNTLVRFRWQLALGGEVLDPEGFAKLAELKLPLVQLRGEWVELQPEQIEAAIEFWEKQAAAEGQEMGLREALQVGLVEEGEVGGLPIVDVEAEGWVEDLLRQLNGSEPLTELPQPAGLDGQLRPYQVRGFSWLNFLRRWGLGACLADDMGLGKTIQAIALFVEVFEKEDGKQPVLVVCPTSVVGNWRREIHRFAPSLEVLVHHGSDRVTGEPFVERATRQQVIITTYDLVRRDEETLRNVAWRTIVLDEAQKIKNPSAKRTQAIRRLEAGYRVALTGTPVENRLSELWSIMQFLNPGYLGTQKAFRERFAGPIERYQDEEAAVRLRKLVQPFILRRVKTDTSIIQDLPEKLENKVYCTLTAEQATLYQAVVEDALQQVEASEGVQRKGLVLAMLTKLKQICNHPTNFLKDGSALQDRSGKLARLEDLLENVLASEERAIIFTQYTEMGTLLQRYLREQLGGETLFLHGGTPAQQRDRMISRFQAQQHGPAVFILSLRAGGLGLNLTRANHVFHFDRWWNPAVEDQATDRAFRIGQTRDVWVHKFVCMGTLEERIDDIIESKKALADSVIGTGEAWLTELDTGELRDLVMLSTEAFEA